MLTISVREHGRTVNVHALIAVGVNAGGDWEVWGPDVASDEDGAGRLAFLQPLTAQGLSGVRLVIPDAHRGLVGAIGARAARRRFAALPDALPAKSVAKVSKTAAAASRPSVGDRSSFRVTPTCA